MFPKKSTFSLMVFAIIASTATASFFAGLYVEGFNSDSITQAEFDAALSKLESKIDSSIQAPTQPNKPPARISVDDDPMKGDPNAPITIIEFSDYECPFCGRFYFNTLPLIEKNYIDTGKVNFVYRDFPIQSIHPNALPAALAAECADDQDMYWQFHDMIFEKKTSWEKINGNAVLEEFGQYASSLGLDAEKFNTCLETGEHLDEVRNDLNDGREYGVTGTPGFFIGNDKLGFTMVSGAKPYPVFESILNEVLSQ